MIKQVKIMTIKLLKSENTFRAKRKGNSEKKYIFASSETLNPNENILSLAAKVKIKIKMCFRAARKGKIILKCVFALSESMFPVKNIRSLGFFPSRQKIIPINLI